MAESVQLADFIVSVNPELLPVGNFVVRCLLKRITMRSTVLEEFRRKCLAALAQVNPTYKQDHDALETAWAQLTQSTHELEPHSERAPTTDFVMRASWQLNSTRRFIQVRI